MGKNGLITVAILAGGGFLAYWYMTNFGPNGAVHNAAGQKIAPSYWDTWFGGVTAAPPVTGAGTYTPGTTYVPPATGGGVPQWPAGSGTPVGTPAAPSLRDRVLAASGNMSALNADQWSYYLTAVRGVPLTPQEFGAAFPNITSETERGGVMTVDQFMAAVNGSGLHLSGIVNLPSMSFGGARQGGTPTMSGVMRQTRKAGYLQ